MMMWRTNVRTDANQTICEIGFLMDPDTLLFFSRRSCPLSAFANVPTKNLRTRLRISEFWIVNHFPIAMDGVVQSRWMVVEYTLVLSQGDAFFYKRFI